MATATDRVSFDELKALAASGDAADRYAAALAYRRLAAYAEAMATYERLVKEAPGASAYRRGLAELYKVAGRPEDARASEGEMR